MEKETNITKKTVSKEIAGKILKQMVNDKKAFKAIVEGSASTKGAIETLKAYNKSRNFTR
jgi:hypothetical protein